MSAPSNPAGRSRCRRWVLAYGFAALIALGVLLLSLPVSNTVGGFTPFMTSFFTATSAVTVTGLTVETSATFWSPFGKAVLLVLIQVGGLGFITLSTLIFLALGRRIGLRERLAIRGAAGAITVGGMVRLVKQVALVVLVVEALGFVALAIRFSFDFPVPTALWHSLFHSVSAFNNAGFVILPGEGLGAYREAPSVLLMTTVLFVLGGISIAVMADVARGRRFGKLSVDSKLDALRDCGAVAARNGPLSGHRVHQPCDPWTDGGARQASALLFRVRQRQDRGVSPAVRPGQFTQSALFLSMVLMFIGGAAGSTAGGIKVNTFAIIIASVVSTIRGRSHVEAFNREVPDYQVSRALTIGVLGVGMVLLVAFLLTRVEEARFIELLFETVSAFGANGYSTGLPSQPKQRWTVIPRACHVRSGRIGLITLVLILAPEA